MFHDVMPFAPFTTFAPLAPFTYVGIVVFFMIAYYITEAVGYYLAYRKAGVRHAWWAFIPILATIPLLDTARMKRWWALIYAGFLIPLVLFIIPLSSAAPVMDGGGVVLFIVALIVIIPLYVALTAFKFYWTLRFYRAFGVHWAFALFMFAPFVPFIGSFASVGPIVVAFWIGLAKDVVYQPERPHREEQSNPSVDA